MTKRIFLTVCLMLLWHASVRADMDTGVIGTILEVQGSAIVTPEGGQGAAAAVDTQLHLKDTVTTGPNSRVFILFIDDTELTLSEKTQVRIDDYIYSADDTQGNKALYSIMMGTFQYISGLIGKKDNPDVQIQTSVGSIGIRGTDFWAGELDGEYAVAVNEGRVSLRTDGGEELVNKGEGTSVKDRRSRPARAKVWNREKLERIAGTVMLQRRELVRQKISAMRDRQQLLRGLYQGRMKAKRERLQRREVPKQERLQKIQERKGHLLPKNDSAGGRQSRQRGDKNVR